MEKRKSSKDTTRKSMSISVFCPYVLKYSNWTLNWVLVRDCSLVTKVVLFAPAASVDESKLRPSLAAAAVAEDSETKRSEITKLTKVSDWKEIEDQQETDG